MPSRASKLRVPRRVHDLKFKIPKLTNPNLPDDPSELTGDRFYDF
jgi:hypothetical protein